jgi:hypothetical protein
MRSRKEDGRDDQIIQEKHVSRDSNEEKKAYQYFPLFKNLFYAVLLAFIISLMFLSSVYSPNKGNSSSNLDRVIASLRNISNNNNINPNEYHSKQHELELKLNNTNSPSIDCDPTKENCNINDHCKGQWTGEKLIGRCFGLKTHSEYEEFKNIVEVSNRNECQKLCCDLGDKCITWQYWVEIKMCKLGGIVRLGLESAPTVNWCEPNPPIVWNGNTVISRNENGDVEWGPNLPTQCFGLGPEKRNKESDRPLTVDECRDACASNGNCLTWQAHSERGCYFSDSKKVYCEPYDGAYDGGRKCSGDKCVTAR